MITSTQGKETELLDIASTDIIPDTTYRLLPLLMLMHQDQAEEKALSLSSGTLSSQDQETKAGILRLNKTQYDGICEYLEYIHEHNETEKIQTITAALDCAIAKTQLLCQYPIQKNDRQPHDNLKNLQSLKSHNNALKVSTFIKLVSLFNSIKRPFQNKPKQPYQTCRLFVHDERYAKGMPSYTNYSASLRAQ